MTIREIFKVLSTALILLFPAISAIHLPTNSHEKMGQPFENKYDLMYTAIGATINTRTVDSTMNIGQFTSLKLDRLDRPHISYYDHTNGDLRYARWTGSGWLLEIVDASGDVGLYTSLALDSNNLPHITYYRKDTGDLRYAWSDGTGFQIETVDMLRDTGLYTSLALDMNDTPYISYYERTRGVLRFAKLNGTSWETETLDESANVGLYTSLALDFEGNPHISYYDKTNGDLKFIEWNGSAWLEPRIVDSDGNVGLYTSLALSSTGIPHISYFDKTRGDLKFAVLGDEWLDIQTVDSSGTVGMYTSLALDKQGKAHISYYDKTKGDLKWASGIGFNWIHPDVNNEGDTGLYTSLDLDSNDRPHISYAGPAAYGSMYPALGSDCNRESNCSYVHAVWMEYEIVGGDVYQRIYYRRSSDKGRTWDLPIRPISSAWKHFAGYPNVYMSGPPSISVVGKKVHVAWAHEYPGGFGNVGIFYQLSEDNGETWLPSEVRIDDIPKSGVGSTFPDFVTIYADENYANVVWQSGMKIYNKRSLVSQASSRDGWRISFGRYSSLAVDSFGRVFIASWDEGRGSLMLSTSPAEGIFDTRTIDRNGVGQYASIALSKDEYPYPRIAYYDQNSRDLKYASWNGTAWLIQVVDSIGDVGRFASIAIDSNNLPHIAYYDATRGNLKYARWNGTSWSISLVDDFGDVGQYTSLKLDSLDRPRIAYYNATGRSLKLAIWDGTRWKMMEVDSNKTGKHASIALDSLEMIHISYYDEERSQLKYAYFDGNKFSFAYPDDSKGVGEYTSIALDSSDRPHISYYDSAGKELKYARLTGQSWLVQVLDSDGDVGQHTSIALDSSDEVHISYYDSTNERLKYYSTRLGWNVQPVQQDEMVSYPMYGAIRSKYNTASMPHMVGEDGRLHLVYLERKAPRGDLKYARFNGTDWNIEVVDSDGIVGLHTSIKLDSEGNPHIAYYDESYGRLKYAKWNHSAWDIQVVDDEGDVGRECSLALDSNDNPHITYMDLTNGPLKYARFDGEKWHINTVGDVAPAAGWYNSLALDRMDNPHISYFSWASYALKYAFYDGRQWIFNHVDSKGWQQNSIALDSNDQPHIAYLDRTELGLKYAYWNGSSWVKKLIDDSSAYIGTYARIAITKDDEPLFSYYDETNGDMKFARPKYPASYTSTVDRPDRAGLYNSLAVDEFNVPHISYYDYSRGDLRYAKWIPGGWSVETIDSAGDTGQYTSIALDANGYPHISYYDDSSGNGIFYTYTSVGGDAPWSPEVLIREETRRYPDRPRIDVEGQEIHVVWAELDENTDDIDIYYLKSEDGGRTWPSQATRISDDSSSHDYYHVNPQVQAVGATVYVSWERRENVGFVGFNSQLVYDVNVRNGDASGWGRDKVIAPNPPAYSRYVVSETSLRVVGNDRHMIWLFWNGANTEEIRYANSVDDFSHLGDLSEGRMGAAGVYLINPSSGGGEIVLIGGITGSGFLDSVMIVSPADGSAYEYCKLPKGIAYSSAIWDGRDSVFVFGGLSVAGAEASILQINLSASVPGNRCTDTGISLPAGMYGMSAVYDPTNMTAYIFGGVDSSGNFLSTIIKWPRLGTPVNFSIMPSERAFTSAVWVDNQGLAYLFGGQSSPSRFLDEIVVFNPESMMPEAKSLSLSRLPNARSRTSAVYDGRYAYIIGGVSSEGPLSEILRFNPNGDWTNGVVVMCPELPMLLGNSTAVVSSNTRSLSQGIFIIGGAGETSLNKAIWRYLPAYWSVHGFR